jgi:gamma-glutamyltranspeptidase/glutathione hydrolase
VIWDAERQQAVALDYRERAPAASTPEMYAHRSLTLMHESTSIRGGQAVAIPGTVAGLCYAAQHYGTLPLEQLLQPAIRLAEQGVPIDQHDIAVQRSTLARFARHKDYPTRFSALYRDYLNSGKAWQIGDRFHSPQLPLLKRIAQQGSDAFYTGPVAEAITREVAGQAGQLTLEDLRFTHPAVRIALRGTFADSTIVTMPPPSSGGVALLQMLNTLQHWEAHSGRKLSDTKHNSADYIHVVTEAMKHAFADRAEFLGDTDFVDVPIRRLLSDQYAQDTAERIHMDKTGRAEDYGRFFSQTDAGTSHFSVIDSQGNAVACTETINLTFGSFVVVPEYGIILNNQMDDFAARPGEPNAFGLKQSIANAVAAGKKPLSSMTPTIVIRNGKAVYATGASGGPRIITATLQSTLNHLLFNMPPSQAVSAPRFHHQWFPDQLRMEKRLFDSQAQAMQARGHSVISSSGLAATQAASQSDTGLLGGSDPRKQGHPAGH